jgi:hypothetical protein
VWPKHHTPRSTNDFHSIEDKNTHFWGLHLQSSVFHFWVSLSVIFPVFFWCKCLHFARGQRKWPKSGLNALTT